MNRSINHPQVDQLESKSTGELITSVAVTALRSGSGPKGQYLPVDFSFPAVHSLEDRLALESELVQLVLSEAEAAFRSPVRHFFNPGGQQLHYNQN